MPGDIISVAKHRYEVTYTPSWDAPPPEEEDPFALGLLEKAGLTRRDPTDRDRGRSRSGGKPGETKSDSDGSDPEIQWLGETKRPE